MKRHILGLLFSLAGSIAHASLVNWTSDNLALDPEVGSSLQSGWFVAMYRDVGGNNATSGNWFNELRLTSDGSVTSSGVTSDDVKLAYSTILLNPFGPAIFMDTVPNVDVADNSDVYTVIFNAADIGSASSIVVADASPFNVGVNDPAADYSLGSSVAGSWQAIPEPAVAGLIVIFGGGMLMSRRIFGKG